MSTLTWITEKELERKEKTRRPISLEEKHNNFIYNDCKKKGGKLAATKSENEWQRKKSEQEHINSLLVEPHDSTYTTSRKSAIEEKIQLESHAPFCFDFFCKRCLHY